MLETINFYISGAVVPLFLVAAGIYYSVRLKFFHLLRPRVVTGALISGGKSGGVSSAKALTLALAGTLGVGNIVGVSSAIYLGGFGAVFWMWVSALVAMILKYAEIVLAMKYKDKDGRGAAMYYIRKFLSSLGLARLGRVLAAVFATLFLLTSLTMGSMLQSNAVSEAAEGVLSIPRVCTGAAVAVGAFLVIRKGVHSISALTNVLVPLMSLAYVVISVVVIVKSGSAVGAVFSEIFKSAFSTTAAASGVGGFIFTRSVRYGIMRGLVSNEAGCGTAPTAHAISDCPCPARQGMWGIFEVFVDTIVLCTMTAIVVILNYGEAARFGGSFMMMTISAYSLGIGDFAAYFLCMATFCFGFATILCWAHYGLVCAEYLFKSPRVSCIFTTVYCATVFIGAIISSDIPWQLSDLCMGAMTVINLLILVLMSKEVKHETDLYLNTNTKTASSHK